jgi:hypothetical protein
VIGTGAIARVENPWVEGGVRPHQRSGNSVDQPIVRVVFVRRLANRAIGEVGGEVALGNGRGRNVGAPRCGTGLSVAHRFRGRRSAKKRQGDQ